MGLTASRPVLHPIENGHEYPVNGAMHEGSTERAKAKAAATFKFCWRALMGPLDVARKIVEYPFRAAAWCLPPRIRAWLAEKTENLLKMSQAIAERRTIRLNSQEIADLLQYFAEDREITQEVRARIAALPEAAQREFNSQYLNQANAAVAAADLLRDSVNANAQRTRSMRDHMESRVNHQPARPAPHLPAAQPPAAAPAPPAKNAPIVPQATNRRAQVHAEIARLNRELADLGFADTED